MFKQNNTKPIFVLACWENPDLRKFVPKFQPLVKEDPTFKANPILKKPKPEWQSASWETSTPKTLFGLTTPEQIQKSE